MKNRTTPKNSTVSNKSKQHDYSTKSVPSIREVITRLLKGEKLHHQDIIKAHKGQQHRLGLAVHKLRHKYGFGKLIQCPRASNHPYQNHYFIDPSDRQAARKLAIKHGLLFEVVA